MNQVAVWLQRGRCRREKEMVEKLIQDGYDPLDIAAAALKVARAEEKQRPISTLSPFVETKRSSYDRGGETGAAIGRTRHSHGYALSTEPGMVRLSLSAGKKHGIHPNDIVGAIAYHADIPGYSIGKIHIQEKNTLVDVPEEFVKQVLVKSRVLKIRKQAIEVQRA